MTRMSLDKLLAKHDACNEGREWAAKFRSPAAAWNACENPQWMLWALNASGKAGKLERKLRLFACWCARHTPIGDGKTNWDLLADERSRNAIAVAERFAAGEATEQELSAARSAAWSAAESAARSAADAWSAARSAARSAAWSAARSAAWSDAWSAARSAAELAQCKQLRKMIGNPFRSRRKARAA